MKAEQLRKSILQMAIQGKLVPQNPDDEPASVLLERIRAEKESLIKSGKIKRDKNDSVIFKGDDNRYYEKIGKEVKDITEEIDFELPNGWEFARIGVLVNIQTGASFKKDQASDDRSQTRVLRGGNILQGTYKFFDNDIFIDNSLVSSQILLRKNDLITPAVTSLENIGKLALIEQSYDNITAGGFVFIIRPNIDMDSFAKYLLYSLQSSYFTKQMKSITKKSGQAFYNLGKERLVQLILPIPPQSEQERIIAEIEKYTPLLNEYDLLEQQATRLDDEIYDKLKKSILQYAIQGKLVPQDENDEPASVLLERIRAEKKAKLGKKYVESYIYKGDDNCYYENINGKTQNITNEITFELPFGWHFARIDSLLHIQTGASFKKEQATVDKNQIRVLRGGNILQGEFHFYDNDIYIHNSLVNDSILLCKNDLITPAVTSIENIGKFALINKSYTNVTAGGFVFILRPYLNDNVLAKYLFYALQSNYFIKQMKAITKKSGQAFYNVGKERLVSLLVPIPSYIEQTRIVQRIETVLKIIKGES